MIEEIGPEELRARLDAGEDLLLLDVREPHELLLARIAGTLDLPLGQLSGRLDELDPERPTVCICHHGIRSAQAAARLAQAGWERVLNLRGGIDAWSRAVDPAVPRY